jgi:aspartate oxidase
MGGIKISKNGESSIPGLFACGEDAGGVHGANRVGGNGMADALVFGNRAGSAAVVTGPNTSNRLSNTRALSHDVDFSLVYYSISEAQAVEYSRRIEAGMSEHLGVIRSSEGINEEIDELTALALELLAYQRTATGEKLANALARDILRSRFLTFKLSLAQTIALSARERGFSLGAHFLSEDREAPSAYNTVVNRKGNQIQVSRRGLP